MKDLIPKNKHAQALGRLGGKARAVSLTPDRRREIARLASEAAKQKRISKRAQR